MVHQGLIVLVFCTLISCNNKSGEKTSLTTSGDTTKTETDTTNDQNLNKDAAVTPAAKQEDYQYDPSVSVVSGTLTTEMFYGAPGYGENPKTDKQEHPYLLILEKPINVFSTEKDGPNTTKNNISKIQLIWPDEIDMSKYKNKTVRLTGIFF